MRFSKAHLGVGAATIALAVGLVGCNNSDGRLALTGSSYCTPFRTAANTNSATANQSGLAATAGGDAAGAFDDCVHRWAYAMAPARDPADIVAHAVVDACGEAMNAWNQQAAPAPTPSGGQDQGYENGQDQGGPGGPQGYGPPPSRGRGGAPDQQMQMQQAQNSPMAQHMQIAEARSLFYVIQARSAGCSPPPANTLASRPAT